MIRRVVAAFGIAALLVLAVAHAAIADPTFTPRGAGPDESADLLMRVPAGAGLQNTRITIAIPPGFLIESCSAPADWQCSVGQITPPQRDAVIYEPATPDAQGVTTFNLRLHTPQQTGTYAFGVDQVFSDGGEIHWDGDSDSETPAPVLRISEADAGPSTTLAGDDAPSLTNDGTVGAPADVPADQGGDASSTTSGAVADGSGSDSSIAAPTLGVAPNGSGVANTATADSVSTKKATNYVPLYIVIALILAVCIPVIVSAQKAKPTSDSHHDHH